jgi:hypothetical protein
MRLRMIDGDPEQTSRIRAWRADHPEYELFRDGPHYVWRLSNGKSEITGFSWGDLLAALDAAAEGWPHASSGWLGPPPRPSRRYPPAGAPDIIA